MKNARSPLGKAAVFVVQSLTTVGYGELLHLALVDLGVLPQPVDYVIRELAPPAVELSIRELAQRYDGGLRFIPIVRREEVRAPEADFLIAEGDRLVVLGLPERVAKFGRQAAGIRSALTRSAQ